MPNELGVVWFSQYAPHASASVPLYVGVPAIPSSFTTGSLSKYDPRASYWVHAAVGNWADRFYIFTIAEIKALQQAAEGALFGAQAALEARAAALLGGGKVADAASLLGNHTHAAAAEDVAAWGRFFFEIIAKYKDGQRIEDPHAEVGADERRTDGRTDPRTDGRTVAVRHAGASMACLQCSVATLCSCDLALSHLCSF